jgi:hypothetical protein
MKRSKGGYDKGKKETHRQYLQKLIENLTEMREITTQG